MTEKYINSVLRSKEWTAHRESEKCKYLYIDIYLSCWGEVLEWSMQFSIQTLSYHILSLSR